MQLYRTHDCAGTWVDQLTLRLGIAHSLDIARLCARIIRLRLRTLHVLLCYYGRLKGTGGARMASRPCAFEGKPVGAEQGKGQTMTRARVG